MRSAYRLANRTGSAISIGPLAIIVADPFGLANGRASAAPRRATVLPRARRGAASACGRQSRWPAS